MSNFYCTLSIVVLPLIIVLLAVIVIIYLGERNNQIYAWRMRWISECTPYMGRSNRLYPELLDFLKKHSYESMIWKFWNRTYESAMGGWTPATYAEHLLQERAKKQAEAEKPPV